MLKGTRGSYHCRRENLEFEQGVRDIDESDFGWVEGRGLGIDGNGEFRNIPFEQQESPSPNLWTC